MGYKTFHPIVRWSVSSGFAVAVTVATVTSAFAAAPVKDLSNVSSLRDQVDQLERIIKANNEVQLERQQKFDALTEEVNMLRGENEEQRYKLEQLVERQRELYQEFENRFSKFSDLSQANATAAVATTGIATGTDAPVVVYSSSLGENEAYDRAMNLVLKERQYDQAIPEFKTFIKKYPNSVYKPNAHYWLGQLLFNKNVITESKQHFDQVVDFYPDSNKRSDAMLKLGAIALKQNDKAAAVKYFEKAISDYPGSTSAKLAESRLRDINQ